MTDMTYRRLCWAMQILSGIGLVFGASLIVSGLVWGRLWMSSVAVTTAVFTTVVIPHVVYALAQMHPASSRRLKLWASAESDGWEQVLRTTVFTCLAVGLAEGLDPSRSSLFASTFVFASIVFMLARRRRVARAESQRA